MTHSWGETTGGGCPLCGAPYYIGGAHGQGICVAQTYYAPPPLTEEAIRRIIREELERVNCPAAGYPRP